MDYKRIYKELIDRSFERDYIEEAENHHIIPRSMGGTDDFDNIARLTYREHFLAHLLLFKIHRNSQMGFALNRMMSGHKGTKQYYNSNLYSIARKHHRKVVSEFSKAMMKGKVCVRNVSTGLVETICQKEYAKDKSLWEGLNKGNRYNLESHKGKTGFKDSENNFYYLAVDDDRITSLGLKGVGCTINATKEAAKLKLKNHWYAKTPNKINHDVILLIPSLYEWYIQNKGTRNCSGDHAMVGYWRRENQIPIYSKLFIKAIENINNGWKPDQKFKEVYNESRKNETKRY